MQREPDSATSFLQLPRELRDRVYDLLLHNVALAFHGSNFDFHLWYGPISYEQTGSHSSADHRIPAWLRTSKQIYHEGREQFFRTASLSPQILRKGDIICQRSLLSASFVNTRYVTKLFLTGSCSYTRSNGVLQPLDISRLGPVVNPSPYCVRLLLDCAPYAKELTLQLKLVHSYPKRGTTKLADLALVTGFELGGRRYDRFRVTIEQPALHRSSFGDLALLMEAFEDLQDQVVRLGKRLVKGDECDTIGDEQGSSRRGCSVNDWRSKDSSDRGQSQSWHAELKPRAQCLGIGTIKEKGLQQFSEWQFENDGKADFSRSFQRSSSEEETFTCADTGEHLEVGGHGGQEIVV